MVPTFWLVNSAAVYIGTQISVLAPVFSSLGYIFRSRIVESWSWLIFWGIAILSVQQLHHFTFPSANAQGFQFLHILTNNCYFLFWRMAIVVVSRCNFDHFPVIPFSDTEHLFMCLFTRCIPSLWKCLFVFCLLLNWVVCFWFLSSRSSLCILGINPLPDKRIANILFHSVGCLFMLLMVSFVVQKRLILMKSTYSFLLLPVPLMFIIF